jgi:3-phytase
VEQWRLSEALTGSVTGTKVRALKLDSTVEGCVADDESGVVYLGEESRGVWKFAAEPDGGTKGELIAKVGENGLRADVEGLALYCAPGGRGYLLVSSQGDNTFKVYERGPGNRFLLTIDPRSGKFGDVQDTDGIAVTSRPTTREFSHGLFIAQDGHNAPARQNFKLFAWEDIAGTNLAVDTRWSPRSGK